MTHLAHARAEVADSQRIRRVTWIKRSLVAAGTVLLLLVAIYVLFTRRDSAPSVAQGKPQRVGTHKSRDEVPATTTYIRVLIDLSNASPARGTPRAEPSPLPQVIPSSALADMSVLLPLGSEERVYSVRLNSRDHVVWSDSAQAHLDNGQTLLHMHADFSHVLVGNYDLVVESKGFRVTVPVVVKITSSGRIQ